MKTTFIYALNCPITGECRYVGKSNNPRIRLQEHFQEVRRYKHYRANWIKSLTARGLKPVLEILDEVPASEWPNWEVAYIEFFREHGCDLVNGNAGGEGGHNPSTETRKKLKAAHSGEKNGFFGKTHTPEVRKIISVARRGKKLSSVTVEKMRAGHRSKKYSNNKSGYAGVCWDGSRQKWAPSLRLNKRTIHLGRYNNLSDAIFVRALAEDKYFG